MSKRSQQNIWLAFAGVIFVVAGLRDVFFTGFLTLNTGIPSRTEVAIAFAVGLFFIAVAVFRSLKSQT